MLESLNYKDTASVAHTHTMHTHTHTHKRATFDCRNFEGESLSALRAEKWMSLCTPAARLASAIVLTPSTWTSWNL